jgi:outer membrane lipoprotein-sorting protein
MKKAVKKTPKKVVKKSAISLKPRGISKVLILAVVGVVLLGAGAYLFMTKQNGGSLSTAVPFMKPALNPNCSYNDPELCKFINNWQVQENYTVTSKSTLEGMNFESVYEMSGTDKFRMVSKQNGKEASNVISIGDTTYTLDYNDNKWWKYTVNPQDTSTSTTENMQEQFSFDEQSAQDNTKYTFVTKEVCGDLQCFKYEIVSPDTADMKQFMWFDDRDYLMRKMTVQTGNGETNESVFSYNKVTITEPSPVKEGMPDAESFGGSEEQMQKMMQEYQESAALDNTQYVDYNAETPVEEGTSSEF